MGGGVHRRGNVFTPYKVRHLRDAILAPAVGYSLLEFRRFVGSARLGGYTGELVLFVSDSLPPQTRAYCMRHNVTLVSVGNERHARAQLQAGVRYQWIWNWLKVCYS